MGHAALRVQAQCPREQLFRAHQRRLALGHQHQLHMANVDHCQSDECGQAVRIEPEHGLKCAAAPSSTPVLSERKAMALPGQMLGDRQVACTFAVPPVGLEGDDAELQPPGEPARDLVLHSKTLGLTALEAIRRDLQPVLRVDQRHVDAHGRALHAHAALDQ